MGERHKVACDGSSSFSVNRTLAQMLNSVKLGHFVAFWPRFVALEAWRDGFFFLFFERAARLFPFGDNVEHTPSFFFVERATRR